ncbi:hypothetical protein DA70_09780 [Pandoraea pnomenusa]|uniref:hypothetical protein n=1 Tax=Pandoraea pnomenusa TaxID=93220 RepID=UPI0004375FAC|nr:hypothetical protein [Pandoraea pnomenusa]AHN74712.1 hypothetical protein DA70_09780 [Pandoraea pnomenusa]
MPDNKTVTLADAIIKQLDDPMYKMWTIQDAVRDAVRRTSAPTPAAQSAGQEAVAWGVYWGVVRKKLAWPPYSTKGEAERAAEQIKSDTEVRPLYAAPVNGGEREQAIEEAAQIADTFKCGTCGMDGKCAAAIRELKGVRAADAQQVVGEPFAWVTLNFATGKPYSVHETEAEADAYIQQVHQSSDSVTLTKRAALTSPAKVPDAVMRALDRMSTPLHDSRLSGLTAELDAANIKTIRDYVLTHGIAKVTPEEQNEINAALDADDALQAAKVGGYAPTDDDIKRFALEHIAPHAKTFAPDKEYKETEQFRRVKAYTLALLGSHAAKVGGDERAAAVYAAIVQRCEVQGYPLEPEVVAELADVAARAALSADGGERKDATAAARDVLAERQRQVESEGWTFEHDDEHVNDEIAALAALYAMPQASRYWDASSTGYGDTLAEAMLPHGWVAKDGDRRRELVKAGALILAEIERIDRAAVAAEQEKEDA